MKKISETTKNLMESLPKARKAAGFTSARQFAAALGVPYPTYAGYESKGVQPNLETLCKIASLCGCGIDELLGHHAAHKSEIERLADALAGKVSISFSGIGEDESFFTPEQRARARAKAIVYLEPYRASLASADELERLRAFQIAMPADEFLNFCYGLIRETLAPALLAYIQGIAKERLEEKERRKQEETAKAKGQKKKAGMNPPGKKG